jgi:hypothetical protein
MKTNPYTVKLPSIGLRSPELEVFDALSASNSLMIRENRGSFVIFGPFEALEVTKTLSSVYVFSGNSLENGTGNSQTVSANLGSLFRF